MNGPHYSQPGSYPGHSQNPSVSGAPGYPPSSGPIDPGGERPPKRDLFAILDGVPSNLMIVFGLFFLLLGITIPGCRQAYAESIEAEWRLAAALMDHDLTQFRDAQEREREQERAAAAANPAAPPDVTANEARRQAALTAEQRRLEQLHEVPAKRRDALEAAAAVEGMFAHRIIEWFGRLLLLLGLIAVTSQAQGLRQKVFVALTVIVLLTSIRGLDLDFDLGTRVESSERARPEELRERGLGD